MLKPKHFQLKNELKPAFGMISLLLGLLIVTIVFALMIPTLKNTSGAAFGPSSLKNENVEEKTNEMINDIQKMRNQSVEYNKQAEKEGY